ncbi:hypothetical protein [Mycolicibacterium setense]|uniref:hypothetical protein n=1 Tax=Mycolicibacterium setense TaxID=431269 RepID=UPI00057390B2|nr:hypothetical protein [Mycolicibacterium setense]KHO25091.1 hypothetical protein QQ25_05195 [Mycolicibacterium setense]MCV7109613.1 hypothetical protein [Mycolicibacterium setense]OBB13205.1 hypothetical protein A5761_20795 [Mycolicibacterium setense]
MPSSPASRRATITFSCWLVGAVLLIAGGMLAVSMAPPGANTMLYRGLGVLTAVAGLGMAFLAGRSRSDDPRYRRAAMALSLAIVVLVLLTGLNVLVLVALLPLMVGTGLSALPERRGDDGE